MIAYCRESKAGAFIIVMENGILHRLRKLVPGKEFIGFTAPKCSCAECSYMKLNTLQKVRNCLLHIVTRHHPRGASGLPPLRMLGISRTAGKRAGLPALFRVEDGTGFRIVDDGEDPATERGFIAGFENMGDAVGFVRLDIQPAKKVGVGSLQFLAGHKLVGDDVGLRVIGLAAKVVPTDEFLPRRGVALRFIGNPLGFGILAGEDGGDPRS